MATQPAAAAVPPASGAWREGDPVGRRQFLDVGPLRLERGGMLPAVRVAYETWGAPAGADDGSIRNAVLVMHALTGDSHVSGRVEPGHPTPGWWNGLIGAGKLLDPARHWIVCPNVLGGCQGTTGPSSPGPGGAPWGSRWPRTTVRDQVTVERRLADLLGRRALAHRARRLDGRDAGAGVGGDGARAGGTARRWWPRRPRRALIRSASRSASWRRYAPIRPGPAATITTRRPGERPARRPRRRPPDRPPDLPQRRGAGDPLRPGRRRTRSIRSTAAAGRSSPTSTITATSWPTGSTRAATSP